MKFEEYIQKIPPNQKCIQGATGTAMHWPISECFLGAPPFELYGREALHTIPENIKGLRIYFGSECESLISAFVKSKLPCHIERLSIGNSSYALGTGRNYEKITRILEEAEYPKLKEFELGVWETFCNAHCLYGCIGNITNLLQRMPNIEHLSLYGSFDLDKTLRFQNLKNLNVTLDDYTTGVNGGDISQNTLNNLLNSFFPLLKNAYLDLDCCHNEKKYMLPELFLTGKNVPSLQRVEFSGDYKKGVYELVENSPLCKQNGVLVLFEKLE